MNAANLFRIYFATPKLNRATPNGVATHSLRSPGLDHDETVKTSLNFALSFLLLSQIKIDLIDLNKI